VRGGMDATRLGALRPPCPPRPPRPPRLPPRPRDGVPDRLAATAAAVRDVDREVDRPLTRAPRVVDLPRLFRVSITI